MGSKRAADEVLGDQQAVKVQKVKIEQCVLGDQQALKIEQCVEKAANVMADFASKMADCMQDQNLDEIFKLFTDVLPSDELVNSLVPDTTLVMRTGNAVVGTGIPREQRIKNAHALIDKAVQHYEESKEDAPSNLRADLAVFGLAMLTTSPDTEVAEFFREFMQDLETNIEKLLDAGIEHLKDAINTPAGMNIFRACVRLHIKIVNPANKLEFAKSAQSVMKKIRNDYETYSRDVTSIIDYYLVAIAI